MKIKKLSEYFNNLESNIKEGLNSPIDVSWVKSTDLWTGSFNIDSLPYEITIEKLSENQNVFLFKFSVNDSYEILNDVKKAFSTIPTIENSVNVFMSEVKPESLVFFALDESETRKRFYTNFCIRYTKENSEYKYKEFTLVNYHFYAIYNEKLDDNEFNKSINKIILKG